MNVIRYIGARLRCACVYFTCTELAVAILFQILSRDATQAMFMALDVTLYIAFFSILLAFAQEVFKLRVSLTAKVLIHALLYMISVFFLFLLITNGLDNVSQLIFILLGALILYIVAGGIILLVYALYNRHKVEKAGYVSQFDGKNGGK